MMVSQPEIGEFRGDRAASVWADAYIGWRVRSGCWYLSESSEVISGRRMRGRSWSTTRPGSKESRDDEFDEDRPRGSEPENRSFVEKGGEITGR